MHFSQRVRALRREDRRPVKKRFPDLLARVVLVILLLFSAYQAAHAYTANAVSSLLYHLGTFCITVTLLAEPLGRLLPPRNATLSNIYQQIHHGKISRMTRMQRYLSMVGFVLLAVSVCLKIL
jgi:hypothetical protein